MEKIPLNLPVFFASIRKSNVFGPTLSQLEVDGCMGILEAWTEIGWPTDLRWIAYTLATAYHEARLDGTIREVGRGAGKAYGVPAGPFKQVYYGRSYVQLTWYDNYVKFAALLKRPIDQHPDLMLDDVAGAMVLIYGSRDGMFRKGKNLARYFNYTTDDPKGARDIINGDVSKIGPLVAGYHTLILDALREAFVEVPRMVTAPVVIADAPVVPVGAPPAALARPTVLPVIPAVKAAVDPLPVEEKGGLGWFGDYLRRKFPKSTGKG